MAKIPVTNRAEQLITAARSLRTKLHKLRFDPPVAHVYSPLEYAWEPYCRYLQLYGQGPKRVLFLGMNPGPFGMVQTGVPFGEVTAVRDWLKVDGVVRPPKSQHPQRPIQGFACVRREISGQRLWGLFAARYGTATRFFTEHFVANYCPLAFLAAGGSNMTPDKLPRRQREEMLGACDEHLRAVVEILQPQFVVGIGGFAAGRAQLALAKSPCRFGQILHPSPACPAANRDWAGTVTSELIAQRIWSQEGSQPRESASTRP